MKPVKAKGWAFVDSDGDILGFSHPNLGGSIQHIFEDEKEAEIFKQKINSAEFRVVPVLITEVKSRKK